jgi:hypothetical protein
MDDLIIYILLAVAVLLGISVIKGAPYLPTYKKTVELMVKAAEPKPGMKAVDLGAGDGRIVIAMALAGAEAHGYEINPIIAMWGKYRIWRAGLGGKAFMHLGNFWGKDLSGYDAVTVFGIPHIMDKLEVKLKKELKPGAKVISNIFQFPTWQGHDESPLHIYLQD